MHDETLSPIELMRIEMQLRKAEEADDYETIDALIVRLERGAEANRRAMVRIVK